MRTFLIFCASEYEVHLRHSYCTCKYDRGLQESIYPTFFLRNSIFIYLEEWLKTNYGYTDFSFGIHFFKSEQSEPVVTGKQFPIFVASDKI